MNGKIMEVEFPLDAAPTRVVLAAGDREGVLRPVGQRPDLEHKEEPVPLQDTAPIDVLVSKVVGSRVQGFLPPGDKQPIHLFPAFRQLAVGQDPLIDLHVADVANQAGRVRDGLGRFGPPAGGQ